VNLSPLNNPRIIRDVLEKAVKIANDYDFGPWTEVSDWREAEERAGRQLLTPEFKQSIIQTVQTEDNPWLLIEPLFEFIRDDASFEEMEKFISSIINHSKIQKYINKFLQEIASKIVNSPNPEEILWFFTHNIKISLIKKIREEPPILELVRKLIKKHSSPNLHWVSYHLYLDKKDAKTMENLEKQVGEPLNCPIVNQFGFKAKKRKVVSLCLISKKLTTIPAGISNFTKLTDLRLNINEIKTIPAYVFEVESLLRLNLNSNKINSFPTAFSKKSKLKELDLRFNKLRSLPKSIGKLNKLQELGLDDNFLRTLPEDIYRLSNLKQLYIADNNLTSLPESIRKLSNLQVLNLKNNKLTSLPGSIINLPHLRILNIDQNPITLKNLKIFMKSDLRTSARALILVKIGSLYCKKKKYKDAAKLMTEAVDIKPDYAYAWNFLGRLLYIELDNEKEAEKAFKIALKINPKYSGSHFHLGYICNENQKYEQASKYLRKTVRLNPKFTEAWISLGFSYSMLKKWKEAENAILKALKLEPKDNVIFLNLGWIYLNQGKLKKSEDVLMKGRKFFPKDGNLCYNLACLYSQKSDFEKSISYLEKSMILGSSFISEIEDEKLLDTVKENKKFRLLIQKFKEGKIKTKK
jgi:Leucine-rich repeat (LRR) protein